MKSPILPLAVAAALLATGAHPLPGGNFFFSHFDGKAGAVDHLGVVADPPAFGEIRPIFADEEAFRLTRLRRGPDGRLFGMNEFTEAPWILAIDPSRTPAPSNRIVLPDRPMELRVAGPHLLAAGHRGMFHLIDPAKDAVTATWTPARNVGRITDFTPLPDASAVIAVQRQDSASGTRRAHRVLVFDLPSLKLRHDLPLPRDRSNLHYPDGGKDSGPGPHFALISTATNTFVLGLNNYGAVLLADLDGVLQGKWKNAVTLPTSADGSWGTSFPSAGSLFTAGSREFALISNGSVEGGSVLVDLAGRRIAQHLATGPRSLYPAIAQPGSRRLVALSSGIQYSRGTAGIDDKHVEPSHFFVIGTGPLESGGNATLDRIELSEYVYEGVPADPSQDDLWVLAVRHPQTNALSLVLYDIGQRKELDRKPAPGVIRNFVSAP